MALEFFVSCAEGLSALVAKELRGFGIRKLRPLPSGVAFFGSLEQGLRVCLWSRLASRVLLVLERVPAHDGDELYAGVKALQWEKWLTVDKSFAIDARGSNNALRDSRFIAMRAKDAIVDRLRAQTGERPSIERERPDVLINVALKSNKATIAIDLSGEPLHRRGYRVANKAIKAPLRETLAAAMLLASDWQSWGKQESKASGDSRGNKQSKAGRDDGGSVDLQSENALGWMLDPMCGSGTIAIEAALIAADRAPGLSRDYWGFSGLAGVDPEVWSKLLEEADNRAEIGLERALAVSMTPRIVASDIDATAVKVARESARKAGVEKLIGFFTADLANMSSTTVTSVNKPEQKTSSAGDRQAGLLVSNPPYGERLASQAQLPALYAAVAGLVDRYEGSLALTLITPDDLAEVILNTALGYEPETRIATMNGPLETSIRLWPSARTHAQTNAEVVAQAESVVEAVPQAEAALQTEAAPQAEAVPQVEAALQTEAAPQAAAAPQAEAAPQVEAAPQTEPTADNPFANRLLKMSRHLGKWARRQQISCYRVYDADLPDYNAAIDIYTGAAGTRDAGQRYLHIAEYAAPKTIEPTQATIRLSELLRLAPDILQIPTTEVFLKRRERAKGGSQYAQPEKNTSASAERADSPPSPRAPGVHIIAEGGLRFEVDLASRLDSGIFLDHRLVRSMLREKAAEKDCLNLFAYTGTASVYMAAGQARSVTSVDLSRTYLDWAERNMLLNAMAKTEQGGQFNFVQADVLQWVLEQRHLRQPASSNTAERTRQQASSNTADRTRQQASSNTADRAHQSQDRAHQPQSTTQAYPSRFGLIFVDVPTFSNSSRMGGRTWDVQRDHAELLISVSRLLTADGQAIFSTNLRNFKPDYETLDKAHVEIVNITAQTISEDFKRRPNLHHCYLITRVRGI